MKRQEGGYSMRNSTFKKVISTLLVLVIALSINVNVSAKEANLDPTVVFDEKELSLIAKSARSKTIYQDKGVGLISKSQNLVASASVASSGTYPTRYGVILITEDKFKGIIPTGHAAIIWTSTTVVESLSNGVTTGPNDWNTSKSTCYGITVSGTTTAQDNAASNWCYKQIGKPYNYNYLDKNTRTKFYCSQLVYAAFLDNYNINIDTSAFVTAVHPMELVDSSNTYTIYVK